MPDFDTICLIVLLTQREKAPGMGRGAFFLRGKTGKENFFGSGQSQGRAKQIREGVKKISQMRKKS